MIKYLTENDIKQLLTMPIALDCVQQALKAHAEHRGRRLAGFVGGAHDLHAAALAAAAGVDLRLDDGDGRAELDVRAGGLLGARHDAAARHGDAESAQELLRLELVDFHVGGPRGNEGQGV